MRDQPIDHDGHELPYLMAAAQLLSACIRQASHRLQEEDGKDPVYPALSRREQEVLQWIAQGKTTWEISTIMAVSEATVAFHVKNLMRKLNVHNRQQALAVAFRFRLIG